MNILTSDMGLGLDRILTDTDIGGLGYGFEYGYSIMEKIKLEGKNGDKFLNVPLISFAAEETAKTKERMKKAVGKKLPAAFRLSADALMRLQVLCCCWWMYEY